MKIAGFPQGAFPAGAFPIGAFPTALVGAACAKVMSINRVTISARDKVAVIGGAERCSLCKKTVTIDMPSRAQCAKVYTIDKDSVI